MAKYIVFKDEEPPHDLFVATAEEFLEAGHFDPAIVAAQTACELVTELALWFWFGGLLKRGLSDAVMDLFPAFNLGNERLLRIYVAISRDRIQEEPFWPRYKEHVGRRHQIVHRGHRSTKAEAEESMAVARDFVEHIKRTLPLRYE